MSSNSNCQKCRQPLRNRLDDSVDSVYDIVSGSLASYPATASTTAWQHQSPDPSRLPPSLRPLYTTAVAGTSSGGGSGTSGGGRNYQRAPSFRVSAQNNNNNNNTTFNGASPHSPHAFLTSRNSSSSSNQHQQHHPSTGSGPGDSFVVLTESVVRPARTAVPPSSSPSSQTGPSSTSSANGTGLSSNGTTGGDRISSTLTAVQATPLTPQLSKLTQLYSLLSARTGVEQPLCAECMDGLLLLMGKEVEEGKKERDRLVAFEREIARRREEGGLSKDELLRDISKLEKKELDATTELKKLEAERAQLDLESSQLDAEEAALALEEAAFWSSHGDHLRAQATWRDAQASLGAKQGQAVKELERLRKTNVYNDAFCIGHEAGFGTINKLRLGRLPGTPVEWPEINAAWGHTLLLLHTLARKFGFTFETYKLIPMGSFSRIEKLGPDKAVYELYGSGDFNAVTRLMQNRRFDMAMVAFLDCLRQLMEFVKGLDRSIKLPHAVSKDKIGDVSIKYQFGTDEAWTRALRHVLFDLKILLSLASAPTRV